MQSTGQKKGIARLFQFAGKYRIFLVLACLFSAVSAIIAYAPFVCIFFVTKELLQAGARGVPPDGHVLLFYGWLAFGLSIASFLLYFAGLMFSHFAAFNTMRNIKNTVMRHLATLPLGFFVQNPSGKLRKIIDDNAAQTETFLAHQMPDLAGSLTAPVVMVVLLFLFDWRLGLLCLVPIAIGFLLQARMMGSESQGFLKQYQDSLESMNKEAVEYVRGIAVVKAFGQTIFSFKNFYNAIMCYRKFVSEYALSCEKPMTAFTTVTNGTFFLLLPISIVLYQFSADKLAFVLSLLFYILFIPACSVLLLKLMHVGSNKMVTEEAVRRLDSLLAEKALPQADHPQKPRNYGIAFSNVLFSYGTGTKNALENFSLTMEEGSFTALVGSSGSGKTTAANLLARFWDVQQGSIRIGGVDVRDMARSDLMNTIGFVFQDNHLFKGSIMENVRAGKPGADDMQVLRALEEAQCGDILTKLPGGADAVIGSKGVYLSGGELQRVALARALLKNAPILLLDEATAFADPENEQQIEQTFGKLMKGKTVLMIAHRLPTVQDADQIVVMENGSIQEKGRHAELLTQGGLYGTMWSDYQSAVTWSVGKEGA